MLPVETRRADLTKSEQEYKCKRMRDRGYTGATRTRNGRDGDARRSNRRFYGEKGGDRRAERRVSSARIENKRGR